jgi:ABC-type Mn2+/Zn2+ transport system ATPase subunit
MAETQLSVRDLHGWYGESHVLHGMSFNVNLGEVVTLLGRNGAGKTTTMRAIMGMLANRKGSIKFQGEELIHKLGGLPRWRCLRQGDIATTQEAAKCQKPRADTQRFLLHGRARKRLAGAPALPRSRWRSVRRRASLKPRNHL